MLFDMTYDELISSRIRFDFTTRLQAVLAIGTYCTLLLTCMVQVKNVVAGGVVFLIFGAIAFGAI